jgi:uncharacterized protein (DUF2336 family)
MFDTEKLRQIPESHRLAVLDRLTSYLVEHGAQDGDGKVSVQIVLKIADVLEVNQRRDVAERFAHAANAPIELVHRFACDNIVVAEPVLLWSKLVDAKFLEDILGRVSDAHLQVVSRRSVVSIEMADVLIRRGSPTVHARLARNANLSLTLGMLNTFMALAAKQVGVEEALCAREDLPEKASEILTQRVGRRLRSEVGSAAEVLSPSALRLALRTRDTDNAAKDSDTQGLSLEALTTITRLSRSGRLTGDHLTDYIRQGEMGAVIACFAKLAEIQPAVARRLILQPSNEGLAVAARAAQLDRSVFEAMVGLKSEMRMSDDSPTAAPEAYDEVPVETAKQIMTFHAACRARGWSDPHDGWGPELPWAARLPASA